MSDQTTKYGDPAGAEQSLFKRGYFIHLKHLPSGNDLKFKAMLTQFEDQYTSDWNTEQVFGRMDPIKSFRGTQRIITLGWDVVAGSLDEAKHNLRNCSTLLSMLYPSYDAGAKQGSQATQDGTADSQSAQARVLSSNSENIVVNNATKIQGAPLFKLKFVNLIQSAKGNAQANTDIENGLVGAIDGLTYAPDVEQGFFDSEPGVLFPQTIRLSFGFTVAHDHPLGWSDKSFRDDLVFPYPRTDGEEI